jgi:hypothetical protein
MVLQTDVQEQACLRVVNFTSHVVVFRKCSVFFMLFILTKFLQASFALARNFFPLTRYCFLNILPISRRKSFGFMVTILTT